MFEKGDLEDDASYRPVSLTSVVCKVFEQILKRDNFSFLSKYNTITGCRHGLVLHRFCFFNLLIL